MERITGAQPPPCLAKHASLDIADMQGMDFPMYVYKPRRGLKRSEDSKDTYKLPHRLIEKKRRDRINECIAQLKDLLPEHLKLTTLGHLEKAVVLELTLKHVKALNNLLEQQQQKIVSLQSGMQISEPSSGHGENGEQMFRSGFHLCAKEVLQFLANQETAHDMSPAHVISHLQKVASELHPRLEEAAPKAPEGREKAPPKAPAEGHAKNCVPVIQRTYPHGSEQSGSDTDTDSGYGGECQRPAYYAKEGGVKEELDEPQAKRRRADSSEDESGSEVVGGHSPYVSYSAHQPPLCMPFYLFPPGAAAAYLPMLEKCWYPGGMPVLYPGMGEISPEKLLPSRGSRASSPASMDSPALLQALKQVPPLNPETKD